MASRILCVDDALQLWGAQRVLLQAAVAMRPAGIDLVLCAPPDSELLEQWDRLGLPHVALDLPALPAPRSDDGRVKWRELARTAVSGTLTVARIRRAAQRAGADALLGNSHATHFATALAARLSNNPVTLFLHEELPFRIGKTLRNAAVRLADQTVAVSGPVLEQVRRIDGSRSFVVANGVDTELFAPGDADPEVRKSLGVGVEAKELLLVAVTRLDPVKRIEDLLTAVAQLPRELRWHLAVVGETTGFPEYTARILRIAEEELGARVSFVGARADIPDVMRAADVIVHTGTVEGLPLGLLEAQACGKPVVAYRAGGVPTLVMNGETGYLATIGDTRAIADGISRLIREPQERDQFGAAGAARTRAHFDQSVQMRTLATLWGNL